MVKYNIAGLKEQCGDDVAFFNEMLDVFARSTREGIVLMEKALMEDDMLQVQHFAHKIISPFRHIEADDIVTRLKDVEHKATIGENKQQFQLLIDELKVETEALIEALKKEYL